MTLRRASKNGRGPPKFHFNTVREVFLHLFQLKFRFWTISSQRALKAEKSSQFPPPPSLCCVSEPIHSLSAQARLLRRLLSCHSLERKRRKQNFHKENTKIPRSLRESQKDLVNDEPCGNKLFRLIAEPDRVTQMRQHTENCKPHHRGVSTCLYWVLPFRPHKNAAGVRPKFWRKQKIQKCLYPPCIHIYVFVCMA